MNVDEIAKRILEEHLKEWDEPASAPEAEALEKKIAEALKAERTATQHALGMAEALRHQRDSFRNMDLKGLSVTQIAKSIVRASIIEIAVLRTKLTEAAGEIKKTQNENTELRSDDALNVAAAEIKALHRERSAHLNLLSGMQNDVRNYLIVTRPDGAEAYSAIVMQAPGDMRPILRFWKDEVEALRKERDAMLKDHAELMEAAESGDRDRTRSAAERDVAIERAERAERFKVYVHQRLDEAGIPTNPGGAHSAKGCRIGDRLDLILAANAREAKLRTALKLWRAFPHTTVPHCGSCGEAGRRAVAMTDAALSGPATGAHGAQACQFCTVGHVKLKAEVVSVIELLEKVQDLLQKINEPCSASYGIQCSIAALRLAVIGDQK